MTSSVSRRPEARVALAAGISVALIAVLGASVARAQAAALDPEVAPAAVETAEHCHDMAAMPEVAVEPAPTPAPEVVAAGPGDPAAGASPFADRFLDVVLRTHEGKNVRFYEDLLKGKIVLINFMYATCRER